MLSSRRLTAAVPIVTTLAIVAACSSPRPAVTDAGPFSAGLDSLVAESMRDGKVPGLALTVVRNDSVVHSRGYGVANLETRVPMTDTTPVVIGSTSKTFTSLAIMQLVEEGRVALDSAAMRYLTSVGTPRDARVGRITVRQLLVNTGGIPAGFSGDAYDVVDTSTDALAHIVRDDIMPRRLDFDPGRDYRYSNRGFALASLVVQQASGMSYEDYVQSRIFEPLGMTHSTGRFWEGKARGMVQGYRDGVDGTPLARPASLGRAWTGSGMILSTSRDVGRYLMALLDSGRIDGQRRLVSAASVAELLRAQQKAESELGGETMYGLGWEVHDMGGVKLVMKGGSVGTMGSLFVLIPERKAGVALVMNSIDYGKVQLVQNVVKWLLGAPTEPYASAPAAAPPASTTPFAMGVDRRRALVGVYDTRAGVLRLTLRGDTLAARHEGNDFVLEPESDTSFIARSALREQEGTRYTFKRCGATMCIWMQGDSDAVRR